MPARLRPFTGPLTTVALTVLAIWGGDRLLFQHGHAYVVKAEFRDSAGLTKNSNVKIGGVAAGRISDLQLTGHDTAMVTMVLDKGAYPIGVGAKAASRPVNLLGEKYVDLDVGDLKRPLPTGVSIPLTRTSRPVELDDVLNTLQPDVRARLRILINEAGIALSGRGADFNRVIDELPSALDQSAKLVGSFSSEDHRLADLIDRSDRVLASVSGKRGDLQDLVDSATDTLKVTAKNRTQLASTVRTAPATLQELRSTMAQLADTSTRLEPFAAQIRAVAPPLTQTLKELPGFRKDAAPALAALRATSPSLTRLGAEAQAPVRRLRPTSHELARFATNIRPLVDTVDRHAAKNLLRLMNGWTRTIAKSDGLGHIFGLRIQVAKTTLTSVLDRYVTPLPPAAKAKQAPAAGKTPKLLGDLRPAAKPTVPKLVPRLPKLGIPALDDALKQVGSAVDGVVPSVQGALGKVTGGLIGKRTSGPSPTADAGSDVGALFDYLVGP